MHKYLIINALRVTNQSRLQPLSVDYKDFVLRDFFGYDTAYHIDVRYTKALPTSLPEGSLGPTITRILVADRNQAALKVFQKELAQGKKKIGILYGAAHMPDFEKRLREDFGLKRAGEQWLTAWDLRLSGE